MKKLKELKGKFEGRKTSRSSSRAAQAADSLKADSASGKLGHPSSPLQAAVVPGNTAVLAEDPLGQSLALPADQIVTLQKSNNAAVSKGTSDENHLAPNDDAPINSSPPISSAGDTKDRDPKQDQSNATGHLSSSPLWQKAYDQVKNDADWTEYIDVVNKSASLAGNSVKSPDRIIAIAQDVSDQVEASKTTLRLAGRTVVVRDVLNKALDVLSVTKDVGASLTSLNPYASLAWGGLQFFVQAAVTHRDVGELCWEELPRMTRLIAQYQTFELLYDLSQLKHTRSILEYTLIELFSAILSDREVRQLTNSPIQNCFPGHIQKFTPASLDNVTKHEAEVTRLQGFADREISNMQFDHVVEMTAAHSQQLQTVARSLRDSLSRSELLQSHITARIDMVSKYVEDAQKTKILEWVSTIKYGNAHNSNQKRALAGTGEWLIRGKSYKEWRNSRSPSHLWLKGSMGSGKSCLTHLVINDLEKMVSNSRGAGLAYFYCSGGSSDNTQAGQILRSILRQLSLIGTDETLSKHVVDEYEKTRSKGELSDIQCITLLEAVIKSRDVTIVVVDGLDECADKVQRDILTSLTMLQDRSASITKIFISSRPEEQIRRRLERLQPLEITTFENNNDDLTAYIQSKVNETGYEHLYHDDDRHQEDAVRNRIISRAGGMFRWAELAFKFLHDSIDFDAMTDRLGELSQLGELFELYNKIYDEMMQRVGAQDRARITMLFMFILHGWNFGSETVAYSISSIAHILEACEFSVTGNASGPPMNVARVPALCPSLIAVTGNALLQLSFPHVSVREWLLTDEKRCPEFSRTKGDGCLAQLCMKVISTSSEVLLEELAVKDTSSRTRPTALQDYSFRRWLDHLNSLVGELEYPRTVSTMWDEEKVLRQALEDFLFNLNGLSKPTGLQLWCKVLRTLFVASYSTRDGTYLRLKDLKLGLAALWRYRPMPISTVLPPFVCAILGYHCDLSRFQEAAMDIGDSQYAWQIRSLGAVMITGDIKAVKWMIESLKPSPDVLVDALVLIFAWNMWPELDSDEIEDFTNAELHCRSTISPLINLLIKNGVDADHRYGPSQTPLLVNLIEGWNRGDRKGGLEACYIAFTTIYFIEAGADALIPVNLAAATPVKDKIYRKWGVSTVWVSELVTVFDWILLWGVPSVTEAVQSIVLQRQWDGDTWTRWLNIAPGSQSCSSSLVQICLERGADPLSKRFYLEHGDSPLRTAICTRCSGAVLDILSFASFGADKSLRVDTFLADTYFFPQEILPKCSKSTVELWLERGADALIRWSNGTLVGNAIFEAAKQRTEKTGDRSVEDYIESLGRWIFSTDSLVEEVDV